MSATSTDRRAIIVEDNALLALLVEDMLGELGVAVVASATTLADAMALAQEIEVHFGVLDLNLDGNLSFPAAEVLLARNIPVIFATGYGADQLPKRFASTPTLEKPFTVRDLEAAILQVLAG